MDIREKSLRATLWERSNLKNLLGDCFTRRLIRNDTREKSLRGQQHKAILKFHNWDCFIRGSFSKRTKYLIFYSFPLQFKTLSLTKQFLGRLWQSKKQNTSVQIVTSNLLNGLANALSAICGIHLQKK